MQIVGLSVLRRGLISKTVKCKKQSKDVFAYIQIENNFSVTYFISKPFIELKTWSFIWKHFYMKLFGLSLTLYEYH